MKTLSVKKHTGQFVQEGEIKTEIMEDVYSFNCETDEEYNSTLYRAQLTVEIHNRDFPDDPWEVVPHQEPVEEPA